MAYRSTNRRNFSGGNYGSSGGGNMGGRNLNPWDNQNSVGGGNFGNNRNQGGQGSGMNAQALTLANNLLNNLLRNQNPPSLLDLPRGGSGGGIGGGLGSRQVGNRGGDRNRRGQGFGRNQKSGANNKGGGIRKQNAFDRAKKLLATNSKNKRDSPSGDNKDKKKTESPKESIYADVPNDMFYCHLCKKDMWDSTSFENHIKGRTHMMMREGIEESYRLKANMIRQEAKIAEQLKMIELDRLKRMGKSKASGPREYCTMCDLNFHGHLSTHRKSEGHLALKKFLHPKCVECNKEFPTRIEYDTHLLLPEHLKKAAESNIKGGEKKKNTLNILTEEDELKDVKPPTKKKKKTEKKEGETAEGEEKKENGEAAGDEEEKKEGEENAEDEKEEEEDPNATTVEDPEDCILDYHDGDEVPSDVDAKLPKYHWQRPVGVSLISKLECYECRICGKFFDTEKTVDVHSRTTAHHRQFLRFINDKASETRIAQKRAAAALEESESKKRKLEAAANGEEGENKEAAEVEKTEGELYDPSEATGDDEDVEMNENPEEDQENEGEGDGEAEVEAEEEADDEKKDGVNGKDEDVKDESMEEESKKEEKQTPAQKKADAKATPQKQENSPAQKATPAAGRAGAQAKGTPRGKGRGRYNRY
uniref:Putative cathepsin b mrna 3'-untranslated-region-binding protein cbbp n=1 Tax=Tabanus bromius TaxID=304241 RepID=A0A0K8TSP6_TABBR